MENVTSLSGPVEKIDGKLVLRIPLEVGGNELVACSKGIGEINGECLSIHIVDWLAKKLGISEGSTVVVDNANGKFNISLSHRNPNTDADNSNSC
jgi:hypothetical protein